MSFLIYGFRQRFLWFNKYSLLFTASFLQQSSNIQYKYNVQFRGEIREVLNLTESEIFCRDIEIAAAKVAANDRELNFSMQGGGYLKISYNPDSTFPEVSGPLTSRDTWSEIEKRLVDKIEKQYASVDQFWIRFDELGGLWYFTQWAQMNLQEKLDLLDMSLRPIFTKYNQVSGIIFSNGWMVTGSEIEEVVVSKEDYVIGSRFMRRIGAYRETFIVGRNNDYSEEAAIFHRFYRDESSFQNWALDKIKIPLLSELIAHN